MTATVRLLQILTLSMALGCPAFAKDCDVDAGVQQCCSAKKCGGGVLNNRDLHNCKNSGGKSWHGAAVGAACYKT